MSGGMMGKDLPFVVHQHPDITIERLAEKGGIVTAAVKKQIRQMIEKGYIQRDNDGSWHIFATASV